MREDQRQFISVVVPCYNEQEVIRETHARLAAVLDAMGARWEVVYVDDGSIDATAGVIRDILSMDDRVRLVALARNFGHQIAVTAGLDHAEGDAVVVIDADLQDPPEVIPALVSKWREGYQVVYGARRTRRGEGAFKLWSARAFYRLFDWLSEVRLPFEAGDFRLLDRRVVDALRGMPERHRFLRAMTAWVGLRQVGVPYDRAPRFAGTTKYPLRKMVLLALDGLISFSVVPLKLLTILGVLLFFASVAGILYALTLRLFTSEWVPGWTLLFIAMLLFGGLQFIAIGVLGEYVGRIYGEVKGRPLYLVDAKLGFSVEREAPASVTGAASIAR